MVYRGDPGPDAFEVFTVPVGGGTPTLLWNATGSRDVTDFEVSSDSANVVYRADRDATDQFQINELLYDEPSLQFFFYDRLDFLFVRFGEFVAASQHSSRNIIA